MLLSCCAQALSWPCATHINALMGNNPVTAAFGKVDGNFDKPHVLNLLQKWWYLWDNHAEFIEMAWVRLDFDRNDMVRPQRGLSGKWETLCNAAKGMYAKLDVLRDFSHKMEFYCTGLQPASLQKDFNMLKQWLHDATVIFQLYVLLDWHDLEVQPMFYWLRSQSKLNAASGPHFRRQDIAARVLQTISRVGLCLISI